MDKDLPKDSDNKRPWPDESKALGPDKDRALSLRDIAHGVLDAARTVLPSIAGIFAGPIGEKAAEAIARAAQRIFGTTDSATIREQAGTDDSKREDLREALYQAGIIHVREQTELRVSEEYRIRTQYDEARAANLLAAQTHPRLVWVPTIMSLIVLVGFYIALFGLIFGGTSVPDQGTGATTANHTLIYIMLGALTTSMTAVITYWLGSSAESARQVQIMQRTLSDQVRDLSARHRDAA